MKRHRITTFYMETLFLIAVLIVVILVLTRVFGIGRSQSREAKLLTSAVSLAQNAAEAVSGSSSIEDAAELLRADSAEGAGLVIDEEKGIVARYNEALQQDPEGMLRLEVSWEPEATISGTLITSHIAVWQEEEPEEPVYTLETAVFLR